jgi:antitoxin component of MazEF toxin-antitoxin module
MSTVRVGSNRVITLPASILDRVGVGENDILEADCVNGVITLTPKVREGNRDNLMDYAGVAARVFGPADRIDSYLTESRDEWER